MEKLFNDLVQHISTQMGNLVTVIDEDYGQPEAIAEGGADEQHPLTFPAVLISMPEVEWSNLSGGRQRGRCKLSVCLVTNCHEAEEAGAEAAAARIELAGKLNACIHGYRFEGTDGPATCRFTRQYSTGAGIKVYEHEYHVSLS